jgi:small subunit ribosomal protein S8
MNVVSMPESRMRRAIARVLAERGYIHGFTSQEGEKKPLLTLAIRYGAANRPIIEGIERVSRPGRRVYVSAKEIPKVRNGIGIAILSTPRGILTDQQARDAGIGGEVLARVW